jgi:hypothetical protein
MAIQQSQQTIQQPKKAPEPTSTGAAIFVMPEEFRFGAKGTIKRPPPSKPPAPKQATAPPPPPPKPPAPKPEKKKPIVQSKKPPINKWFLVLAAIVILLVIGLVVMFIVLQQEENVEPAQEDAQRPVPEIVVPVESEPVPDEDPETDPDLFEAGTTPGIDTDSDGLTDLEEILIYETDSRLPDTDSDGFLDGNEVFHRYHPDGLAPYTLLDSGVVEVYQWTDIDGELVYSILHPSMWKYEEEENNSVPKIIFKATTGERIEIELYEYDFEDIAMEQEEEEFFSTTSKNGHAMLVSNTQLKSYVQLEQEVYFFRYDPGIKGTIDYLQTFQMMLNSLEIVSE